MSAISDITSRRDKLLAAAVSCIDAQEVVDGPALGRMTDAVVKLLPPECTYDTVFKSLSPFMGSKPDLSALKRAAWAIAANLPLIKSGVAPYPPRITSDPHKVTIQVLACRRLPDKKGQHQDAFTILYRGRIISGFGCPLEIEWHWSSKFVAFRASHPGGFGFKKPKYNKPQIGRPYQQYSTLVGMRFTTDLSVTNDGKKILDDVRCGQSLQEYNRALTEMRHRTTFDCPMAYTHPCHHCHKGQESCSAACHPKDYETKICAVCGQEEEHDAFWGLGVCNRCAAAGKRRFP